MRIAIIHMLTFIVLTGFTTNTLSMNYLGCPTECYQDGLNQLANIVTHAVDKKITSWLLQSNKPCLLRQGINMRARQLGMTPIFAAVFDGLYKCLPFVVTPEQINMQNDLGVTPLAMAAGRGQYNTVAFLLERGANSELEDSSGLQAIDKAEAGGFQTIVELLIEHEMHKHPDVPYQLIHSIKKRARDTNRTPVFVAVQESIIEAVPHLITENNINVRNAQGETLLTVAAANERADLVTVLLTHGADPALENSKQLRAIDIADAAGFKKVVEVLVAHNLHKLGLDKTILVPAAELVAPAPITGQPVVCSLCLENKRDIVTLTCSHQYCRACLINGILASAIRERRSNMLRCPHPDCRRRQLELTDLQLFATQQYVDAILEIKVRESLVASVGSKLKQCPTPNCPNQFEVVDDRFTLTRCGACTRRYCIQCLILHSNAMTCQEARAAQGDAQAQTQETEKWKRDNSKQCPGCKVFIERSAGCNHMTCRRCSHEFCWLCMKKWPVSNHTCPLFGPALPQAPAPIDPPPPVVRRHRRCMIQ